MQRHRLSGRLTGDLLLCRRDAAQNRPRPCSFSDHGSAGRGSVTNRRLPKRRRPARVQRHWDWKLPHEKAQRANQKRPGPCSDHISARRPRLDGQLRSLPPHISEKRREKPLVELLAWLFYRCSIDAALIAVTARVVAVAEAVSVVARVAPPVVSAFRPTSAN